jgi:AraC-like DNA-binding protein
MDPLSDTLRVVRLTGAAFYLARMTAPWAVQSPSPDQLARRLRLRADTLALFRLVVEGRCLLALDDTPPLELAAGTVVVFPHGESHGMMSRLRHPRRSLLPIQARLNQMEIAEIACGEGTRPSARLVCGYLQCDQRFNPLIGAMPAMLAMVPGEGLIVVTRTGDPPARLGPRPGPRAGWMERACGSLAEEAIGRRPGSSVMVARLAELLYLELLRLYIQHLPDESVGWPVAVRDPRVGLALRLLHERPGHHWSVPELARRVGLSRSALGDRFSKQVGRPPMRYLTAWRMQLAQHLLRQPRLSIGQVAARLGFDADSAFHRAFKRETGLPPATWRAGLM